MNKPSKSIIVGVAAVSFLAVVLWNLFLNSTSSHDPASKTDAKNAKSLRKSQDKLSFLREQKVNPEDFYKPNAGTVAQMAAIFSTPIEFYGKVIDQHENPVEGADVEISVSDDPTLSGKRNVQRRKSDASGLFSISGIHGMAIYVSVAKQGYYKIYANHGSKDAKASQKNFSYGFNEGQGLHRPDKSNPAILELHKADSIEPLIHQGKKIRKISNDGTVRRIPLNSALPDGPHCILVECWVDPTQKDNKFHYPWRMRLSVPNGGLVLRRGQFEFQAPTEGYVSSVEHNMTANPVDGKWSDGVIESYFVHFNDGYFGRFDFELQAHERSRVIIESHLNPKVGSRNLTADPDENF